MRARDDVPNIPKTQVSCKQTARLRRRYDDEGLPFPEAVSAIAMAAPIEPKLSPAASEKLSSSAVDLLKMAEARTAALQTKVIDRYAAQDGRQPLYCRTGVVADSGAQNYDTNVPSAAYACTTTVLPETS